MLRHRLVAILLGATALLGATGAFVHAQDGAASSQQARISDATATALLAEVRGLRADLATTMRSSMRLELIVARLQVEDLRTTPATQGRIAERQRIERDLTAELNEVERALSQR